MSYRVRTPRAAFAGITVHKASIFSKTKHHRVTDTAAAWHLWAASDEGHVVESTHLGQGMAISFGMSPLRILCIARDDEVERIRQTARTVFTDDIFSCWHPRVF